MNICLIEEAPIVQRPMDILNLSTNHENIVEFTAIIQTTDDLNENKRVYPSKVLNPQIEQYIQEKVIPGNAVGELDHPDLSDDESAQIRRQLTVKYSITSHKFLKIWVEGNKVYQRIKTTRTSKGYDLAGLILDGISVGFSLRAWGEVGDEIVNGQRAKVVKAPVKIMCWDAVCDPSHKIARLLNINSLQMNNLRNESMIMTENSSYSEDLDFSNELLSYRNEYMINSIIQENVMSMLK